MNPAVYAILFAAGAAAGVINTVAGGGSVLTLPALIFAGVPPGAANATNRIGVIAQNLVAVRLFRKQGIAEWPLTWRLMAVGAIGSIIGTYLATRIPDDSFEKVLGVFMLGLLPLTMIKPKKRQPNAELAAPPATPDDWSPLSTEKRFGTLLVFFLLGVYGGFLQAGIGIMIMIAMDHMIHSGLIRANYVKLVFILAVTAVAFSMFLARGIHIEWVAGAVVTLGQMIGAWAGSWVAIRKGERVIRAVMVISILLSSAKLLGLFG